MDDAIEQEIQAKGLTAPRVTPADIEAEIASEHFFTASPAFGDLPFQERNRLSSQADHMSGYLNVLYARIADFKA